LPVTAGDAPSGHLALRREGRYFAELVGLSALAVAQPVLDVFGKAPDAFVFRQADAGDIVAFALVVALVPPLVLWALTAPLALVGPRARRAGHLVALGVLLAAFVVLLGREALSLSTAAAAVLALATVAGFAYLYWTRTGARTWVAFLAPAAPIFVVLFLTASPTAALLDQGEGPTDVDAAADGPPVVLLVLDELPLASLLDESGQIDAGLYPNLAELAGDATWYRNTTSVASATWHAVPSLLTGLEPERHATPTYADNPDSAFTAFGGSYDVIGAEMITRLCPPSVCDPVPVPGVPAGLAPLLADSSSIYRKLLAPSGDDRDPMASYLEATIPTDHDARDDAEVEPAFEDFESGQPARYADFVERLGASTGTRPFFAYLHVLLPHEPWRFFPSGVEYETPPEEHGRAVFNWSDNPPAVDVGRQRHVLQAMYTDSLVGGVIDRLQEVGIYDEAVVAVVADHGVAFTPGESMRGTAVDAVVEPVLSELMWVPFLVKAPGLERGAISDENVTTLDVVPTLADLAGIDLGYETDGTSVVDAAASADGDGRKVFWPVEMSPFGNVLGDRRDVDSASGLGAVFESAIATFLPDRSDPALRPYRVGPFGPLVGQSTSGLTIDERVAGEVHVERGRGLADLDDEGPLPALVAAAVEPAEVGTPVAVAVDGRIAGVTRTFDWEGSTGFFTVLVPDILLEPGSHDVAYFVIEGDSAEPVLRPLTPSD
jgi:hypothetical protein